MEGRIALKTWCAKERELEIEHNENSQNLKTVDSPNNTSQFWCPGRLYPSNAVSYPALAAMVVVLSGNEA
jgi:hypothetical protein